MLTGHSWNTLSPPRAPEQQVSQRSSAKRHQVSLALALPPDAAGSFWPSSGFVTCQHRQRSQQLYFPNPVQPVWTNMSKAGMEAALTCTPCLSASARRDTHDLKAALLLQLNFRKIMPCLVHARSMRARCETCITHYKAWSSKYLKLGALARRDLRMVPARPALGF